MVAVALRRLALGLLLLWLVSVLVFAGTHFLPGDAARVLLGRYATPDSLRALREQLHLMDPLPTQYWNWSRGMLTGQWGMSLVSPQTVSQLVAYRVVNSGVLVLISALIATPLAIAIGTYSATRARSWVDHGVSLATLILAALPAFVIGIALVYLLATNVLHLLPAASIVDPTMSLFAQPGVLVLPALTLVLAVIPYAIRMVRASMIEVLESEYVAMARLKGLPEGRVVIRHALRNAIAPAIQASALNLLFMAGGVVVVETVFGFPGIGSALVEAVNERDIPVIQTLAVLVAAFYIVVNLVADLLVILVTPRLRTRIS
jgi:peptide/nickel transport system permease protein